MVVDVIMRIAAGHQRATACQPWPSGRIHPTPQVGERMRISVVTAIAGGFLIAMLTAWAMSAQYAKPAATQNAPVAPPPSVTAPEIGRYQIVNGTPGVSVNITLLDTVTGDSWVKCSSAEVGDMWCKMPRSHDGTNPKK